MHWMYFCFLFPIGPPIHVASYKANKKWLKQHDQHFLIYGNNLPDVNCEHIIPRSLVRQHKLDNRILNDLHLLALSNAKLNTHRQNYKFTEFPQETKITFLSDNGDITDGSLSDCKKISKRRSFEPTARSKGRIARSIGYFMWTYDGAHLESELLTRELLLQWNRDYPVCEYELERHNKVFEKQKNRNIFIVWPWIYSICFSAPVFHVKKCFDSLGTK